MQPLSDERWAVIEAHVMHTGSTDLDHVIGTALMAPELVEECRHLRDKVDRLQTFADRLADRAGENYQRVIRAEQRVAELHDMLERVQWGNTGACPECKRLPPTHALDCALDAALRGAGGE